MNVAGTVEATVAAIGIIGGIGSFVFYAGKFSSSVEQNTKATSKLTESFDKFSDETKDTLVDHEVRITVLEKKK
jgi:hypothetical protein